MCVDGHGWTEAVGVEEGLEGKERERDKERVSSNKSCMFPVGIFA